jgi:hypothetical protein
VVAELVRPRWRCGQPGCPARRWQPVPAADPGDHLAALAALDGHYAAAHADLDVGEVSPDGRLCAAA